MLRIPVTYDLKCEILESMKDKDLKSPHCYITRNSKIVAIVRLNPISIEKGADLLKSEVEDVLSVVTENQYELEEAFRKVVNGW